MYQKVIFLGNLGRDPEMRYTQDGQAVTNLSVATNEQWTDRNSGEQVKRTTWWRVSVWGKAAEACNEFLVKGRQVLVEGRMQPDPQTGNPEIFTRQDGTVGTSYEVRANVVKFVGARGDVTVTSDTPESDEVPAGDGEADELPF